MPRERVPGGNRYIWLQVLTEVKNRVSRPAPCRWCQRSGTSRTVTVWASGPVTAPTICGAYRSYLERSLEMQAGNRGLTEILLRQARCLASRRGTDQAAKDTTVGGDAD